MTPSLTTTEQNPADVLTVAGSSPATGLLASVSDLAGGGAMESVVREKRWHGWEFGFAVLGVGCTMDRSTEEEFLRLRQKFFSGLMAN